MSKVKKNIIYILNRDWDFFYLVPGVNYNVIKEKALKTLQEETNNLFYLDSKDLKEWGLEPLNILLYKLIKDREDFKLTFLNSLNILHYIEKNEKYKELSGIFYSISVNALFCYVLRHFNSDDDTFRDLLNEDLKNLKWRLASGSVL
jgi:hypothetical protein